MELSKLEGSIIGVITKDIKGHDDYKDVIVKDIIPKKITDSLKMVNLEENIQNKTFKELSSRDKNKIILASQLQNDIIILYDFTKGMLKKDLEYFKKLFKRIANYGKKIILVTKDANLFLGCVDKIYLIEDDKVVYQTDDCFDLAIYNNIDMPLMVEFIQDCYDLGIHLDAYTDINELIKAIYRIKS